jgi:F0F1-type ATP synthase assembly protein I
VADESQSPLARAYQLASQCVTIVLGTAIPAVLGFFLDRWLGTTPGLLALGFAVGFPLGVWRLLQVAKERGSAPMSRRERRRRGGPSRDNPTKPPGER